MTKGALHIECSIHEAVLVLPRRPAWPSVPVARPEKVTRPKCAAALGDTSFQAYANLTAIFNQFIYNKYVSNKINKTK